VIYLCPICNVNELITDDPNDNRVNWVALGEVVCGYQCHEKAHDLVNPPERRYTHEGRQPPS
jgi:hypothetical protein